MSVLALNPPPKQKKLPHLPPKTFLILKKRNFSYQNQRIIHLKKQEIPLSSNQRFLAPNGLESLRVQNMMKNHKLAKAIAELGFSAFKTQLLYKAQYNHRSSI